MKLIVSSFVCVSLLAGCERQPPTRPTPPRSTAAPAPAPAPAPPPPTAPAPPPPTAPAATLDAGAEPERPPLPQTPEAIAAYARIDAGVPSVDGGPRPITGHPRR
jgi:hypothetical protein